MGLGLGQIRQLIEQINPPELSLVRRERPYKFPKGYISWEVLSALIAATLYTPVEQFPSLAAQFHARRTQLWFLQNAPVYCLSVDLLRSFQQSDVLERQSLLKELEPPLPTFMLLFPSNSIRTPDGQAIDFAIVHLSDVEHKEWSIASAYGYHCQYQVHEHERNLHWSSADSNETVWFSGMGLHRDGTITCGDDDLGNSELTPADREFLRSMRSLTLQCMLALTYRPDLITEAPITTLLQPQGRSQGRGKRVDLQVSNRHQWQPRWLGKDYRRPTNPAGSRGSHASPKAHWRLGTWRHYEPGEGKRWKQAKVIWIEPTYVGD